MTLTARTVVRLVRRGDRRDIAAFVDLPERLHSHHPQWTPTGLRSDGIRQLGRDHPFHRHSSASFFLAERDGQVVGRISAIENRPYNNHHGRNAGFVGSFDTVDDLEVSSALVEAACASLRRRGLSEVIGPRGISGLGETLLVEGFEHPPVGGVAWNPPYYAEHLTAAGFEPMVDFLSGWLPGDQQHAPVIEKVAGRARRNGFETKTFRSRAELKGWLPRIIPVFLQAMSETVTFYPPSQAEIDDMVGTVLRVADPRGVTIVLKEQAVVGFLLSYPDLGPALRRTRGRLLPWGWVSFLRARTGQPVYAINGLGVLPEHRGLGVNALLYSEITQVLPKEVGIERAEIVQVSAANQRSIEDMTALGVNWYKTHRLYRRDL
jgi:ribosomal protein S18 acetylase RimI-like enzyme